MALARRYAYGGAALIAGSAITAVTLLLAGCGGSGGSKIASLTGGSSGSDSSTVRGATGSASFTVKWPTPSGKLIPAAANSIVIQITRSGSNTVIAQQTLARPAQGGTSTASFPTLPVGTLTISAVAHPNTDGSGTAQASASAPLTIQGGQNTAFSLTMQSTIDHLVIAPSPLSLDAGTTSSLTATAVDASGAIVLTSAFQWSVDDSAIASVDQNGVIQAAVTAAGKTTQVTVKETESNLKATVQVTVTTPPSPSPSPSPSSSPSPSPTPTLPPPPVTTSDTQYQLNPSHTGFISFGQSLNFPSQAAWSVDLGGVASYPIIVGGKVFVTAADPSGNYGTVLYALDKATGATVWGPIPIGGTYFTSWITYDNGKVFVVNEDGLLKSFDAATGTAGWSVKLGQYSFSAPPTAVNGTVYIGGAGSGGTLYAVDETNGAIKWGRSVENGDYSSPTLSPDGSALFVAYPCQAYAFNPQNGALLWHYNGPCEGGGGATTVYANGQLYARDGIIDPNHIFDAKTGSILGTFSGKQIPAMDATNGYFLNGNTLRGINLASKQILWSFAGDGNLVSAPIVIDQTVFIGSSAGNVYAVNLATGAQIWSASANGSIRDSNSYGGLAAGEGYLAAAYGKRLTLWHLAGN